MGPGNRGHCSSSSKISIWGTSIAVLFVALLGGHCFRSVDSHKLYGGPDDDFGAHWLNHGNGLLNQRNTKSEHKISITSVSNLSLKWEFIVGNDTTATPAVSEGMVYFPSWNGNLYAVTQNKGELVWQKNLTLLTGASPTVAGGPVIARATPTICGEILLIGTSSTPCLQLGINKTTGNLLWKTLLDDNQYALITMSGQAFEGFYYIGTSSEEEVFAENCCNFQGAFFKLNITTGEMVWRVPMLPDNGGKVGGYSGSALWGSSPPIDVKRRAVYMATGNTYTTPANVTACELAWQNQTDRPTPDPCLVYDNHQESILSVSIDSGEIKWATKLGEYDTFIVVCSLPPPASTNCPPIPGPDADFGEAPMLLSIPHPAGRAKGMMEILVTGQKSGFVWGLDADDGSIVWAVDAGPGGSLGGASWGMATDGELVFTNIINNQNLNFTLLPSTKIANTGGWVAMDAATGKVVWTVANPFTAPALSPVTHANGVVFVGSTSSPEGGVLGLDAKTGKVLWTKMTNGTVTGGFSVVDGCGFVGVGASLPTLLAIKPVPKRGISVNAYCV